MRILCVVLSSVLLGSAVQASREEMGMYEAIVTSINQLNQRLLLEDSMKAAGFSVLIPGEDTLCYPYVGCFYRNGTLKHIRTLPNTPELVNTTLYLFTPRNKYHYDILKYTDPASVDYSHYDPTLPLKVIIHGFGGRKNITWMWDMKNVFLEKYSTNVLLVEWADGAKIPYYVNAVANTELVGRQVAALLLILKERKRLIEPNVHIIGFSLGGQVAGFVGKRLMAVEGRKPGKITALDPAGPLFEGYGEDVRVSHRDADFVEVIHTNADGLLYGGLGMGTALGHVDFYPNGGKRQPGCPSTITGALQEFTGWDKKLKCNHNRAHQLYIQALQRNTHCEFVAYSCQDGEEGLKKGKCSLCSEAECGRIGYETQGRGALYLLTHESEPYCSQNVRVSVKFSEEMKKSYGEIILSLRGSQGKEINFTVTGHDAKLEPGEVTAAMLNGVHPFPEISSAYLVYAKYKGWFTSGIDVIHVDSILVEDVYGELRFASCNKNLEVKDKERTNLEPSSQWCRS